ncbi:MAG: hypothetical protein PHR58_04165 [Sphaerochaetaceae bacterium]|nr:hypothetical protein [Sphaerochaetaceae bacterium]
MKVKTFTYHVNLIIFAIGLLLFSSCSSVFKAGLSGSVWDSQTDNGITGMEIYAYTNEKVRDADYASWTGSPNTSSSYVARATSAQDGSFTINKIAWETLTPQFGKSGDYREVFLLFYHEDYGLHKNSKPIWITSDSTNESMVNERFTTVNQTTTLVISIVDVGSDQVINTPMDLHITIPQQEDDTDPDEKQATVTGTGNVEVTYPKTFTSPSVTIEASLHGSDWIQCDEDGTIVGTALNPLPTLTVAGQTTTITVYMKSTRLSYPSIGGKLDFTQDALEDYLKIWLAYRDTNGKIRKFDDPSAGTTTTFQAVSTDGSVINHGLFSGLGEGMTWTNNTYAGTYDTKQILIIIDATFDSSKVISGKGNNVIDENDCYLAIDIASNLTQVTEVLHSGNVHQIVAGDL